jgi:acetyl-CoA acetyltransferase
MTGHDVVILGTVRTPIGKDGGAFKKDGGAFKDVHAPELGAVAARAAEKRGLPRGKVDVISTRT